MGATCRLHFHIFRLFHSLPPSSFFAAIMSKTTEAAKTNEVHHIEVPSPEKVKVVKKNTQRCSSCGKWKTPDLFDGKATCNECRPKKRRQGAVAVAEKRATMDKIGEQNTTLMFLVKQQAMELSVGSKIKGRKKSSST